jgi:hypothetical protein
MHGDKRAYSKEDRNMGLISKATRSDADIIYMTKEGSAKHIYDTMIVNQLTKSEMITNALDERTN